MGRHAARARSRTSRWLVRLRAVLAGGLVLGIGTTMTLAAWTDNEYAAATVTAGSFGIVGAANGTTFTENATSPGASLTLAYTTNGAFSPGSTAITRNSVRLATNAVPGTVTMPVPVTSGNATLISELRYSVRVISGTVATPNVPTCATVFSSSQGTLIVDEQRLTAGATASQSLTQTTSPTIQHYCIRLTMDADAGNEVQNQTAQIVWQWAATSS